MRNSPLKAFRRNAGYTNDGAARRLGISKCTLYAYECGVRKVPVDMVKIFSSVYGVSTENVCEAAIRTREAYEAAYKRQNDAKEG